MSRSRDRDRIRARAWCFTINSFTQDEEQCVFNLENDPRVVCVIAEEEHLGENDGTPHIQGYVAFDIPKDLSTVKRLLGGRCHVERAMGSREQNIAYCSKEGTVIVRKIPDIIEERLKKYKQKEDRDQRALEIINDARELGESDFELKYPVFMLHNRKIYRSLHHDAMVLKSKTWDGNLRSKNFWIWGPPGVGKSMAARKGHELAEIFNKPYNKWWNGYTECYHTRVIIDDWPKAPQGDALCQHLKIWGDRYPFTGEVKGGSVNIVPTFSIVITSNYSIDEAFSNEEDRDAIKRRFKEIHMSKKVQDLDTWILRNVDNDMPHGETDNHSESSYEIDDVD